jgi:23S rRNA (cytidine1920-2'-O)/16S rRNA (cytidine1409-2'-O)-methyltransferase
MTLTRRADVLLVERGFFDSRARAQAAIAAGLVVAGGEVVRKASQAIAADAAIIASPAHPYVSRGGVKLQAALDHFAITPTGWVAADIGSSTGGFTQVLLLAGAAKVYAIDSGREQMHAALRGEPRLILHEAYDARRLDRTVIPEPLDLIVCDVSFISLTLALPAALALARPDARLVALIKPQFEAGRREIGSGGIVRDEAVHASVCTRIADWLGGIGWQVDGLMPSPVTGGDGNREFLIAATAP